MASSTTPESRLGPASAAASFAIQELLGHKDVRTTMIYAHVLNRGGHGVRSPIDDLVGERQSAFNEPSGSWLRRKQKGAVCILGQTQTAQLL